MNKERGVEVTVPHLAESLVSATVAKWLKHPGDVVREYDVLCELSTDKVNVEMPSPMDGTLQQIIVQEGETAAVGAPICLIQPPTEAKPSPMDSTATTAATNEYRTRYSPAVQRLAEEHKLDLQQIQGTGLGGRITRKDVLSYLNTPHQPPATAPVTPASITQSKPPAPAPATPPSPAAHGITDQVLPLTPTRSTIAFRMRQSVTEIPHAWLMMEADVSQLVALRNKLKESFLQKEGVRLTFIPFVVKAMVGALKDFPVLNSTWASDQIILKKDIHVSIAIGLEDSVITPVIRNADRKTIAGLAIELDDLTKRARSGKLTLSELQGGTITFNNTGSFGSIQSVPIINYPQAAIMTFEAIVRRPVAIQDMITIRSIANLCLSLDHRILDGVVCGRFLQKVKQNLEHYTLDTTIY